MLRGMRFRLNLTTEQAVQAGEIAGVCRTVWNTGLDLYRHYARANVGKAKIDRIYLGYVQLARELARARTEIDWLAAGPSTRCSRHCGTWTRQSASMARGRRSSGLRTPGHPRSGSPTGIGYGSR